MSHKYLVDRSLITIYYGGTFCLIEIDFKFGKYRTFQFFTNNGFFNTFTNERDGD